LVAANHPVDGWQIVSDSGIGVERLLLAEPGPTQTSIDH
jgi:hypothetical protein